MAGLAGPPEGDTQVAAAPVLRFANGVAHNLPVQLTTFIGRDAEISEVRALLADSRLVTLTGAGGVGKTRLALQAAATVLTEFAAGVWLVDLAPLTDDALVPLALAGVLGVSDERGRSTTATVTRFIRDRRMLVVLDNCEHMLDACALLAEELLRACPAVVVLATSREPIGVAGETTWRVPSLSVNGEAVELFADRAQRARAGFVISEANGAAVAEICRRLDGIPLAIELAAARLRAFSPAEIAAGLHDRFRLLTGGSRTAVRRQQTLRASVDWSHALLTEPERVMFRRLAVFAGGFELGAAEIVGSGNGLDQHQVLEQLVELVDKSLVAAEESEAQEATRYALPETIRQYAAEKLAESGEADAVRTLHRDHYAVVVSELAQRAGDRRHQIRQVEDNIDNLRAAFQWSLELSDRETALRLASWLWPIWRGRSRMREGLAWLDSALGGEPDCMAAIAPDVRVRALVDAVILAAETSAAPRTAQAEEAVALARQLGDHALLGRALLAAGLAAGNASQDGEPYIAEAAMLARQAGSAAMLAAAGYLARDGLPYIAEATALARQADDAGMLAEMLRWQAFAALDSQDLVAARSAAEEAVALAERAGRQLTSLRCRTLLGTTLILQGEFGQARSLLSGVIAEAESDELPQWKMHGLANMGWALAFMGLHAEARVLGEASIAIAEDLGMIPHAMAGYTCLAHVAMASGDADALREVNEAAWQRSSFRPQLRPGYHINIAVADLAAGDFQAAREQADQAIAAAAELGLKYALMSALLVSAGVAAAVGDVGRAHDDAYHALTIGRDIESQSGVIGALECLGALAHEPEEQHKAARLLGAADAHRRVIGYRRFPLSQPGYDRAVADLRTAMGDAEFDQAWDAGAALTLDEAVNYAVRGRGERNRPAVGWLSLTPTECDVARLVAEGLANKDIAARLFVSPRTVQTHLTHVYGKLGITSRVQLAQQAARHAGES
jgi:predicted ATPase/DNA-binding CsgD family transcriptional regulator